MFPWDPAALPECHSHRALLQDLVLPQGILVGLNSMKSSLLRQNWAFVSYIFLNMLVLEAVSLFQKEDNGVHVSTLTLLIKELPECPALRVCGTVALGPGGVPVTSLRDASAARVSQPSEVTAPTAQGQASSWTAPLTVAKERGVRSGVAARLLKTVDS